MTIKIGDQMIGYDDTQEPEGFMYVGFSEVMRKMKGLIGVVTHIKKRRIIVKFGKNESYLYELPYAFNYIVSIPKIGDFVIAYNGEDDIKNKIIGCVEDIDTKESLVSVGDVWYENYKKIDSETLLNFINNEQIYNRI